MNIQKDISELIKAEIIDEMTAARILEYYKTKKDSSTKWLFAIFGVLGAILMGLGIR